MRRAFVVLAALLAIVPASVVLASGGTETPAADSGKQSKPVVVYIYNPGKANDKETWDRLRNWIIKQSGVQFQERFVQTNPDYQAQLTIALAGKQDVDLIAVANVGQMLDFVGRGALAQLNASLDKYGADYRKNVSPEVWKSVTDKDGKIWCYPLENTLQTSDMMSVRADWLKKLGMGEITSIADLEAYMRKAMKADFDGNGKDDTVGIIDFDKGFSSRWDNSLQYVFTETNGTPGVASFQNYLDPQGRITPNVMHPGYKAYIGKMAQWYKEGLMYQEQYAVSTNQVNDLVTANKVATLVSWYSSVLNGWEPLLKTVPDSEYVLAFPKTVNGNLYAIAVGAPARPLYGVTSYSTVVDWCTKLLNWANADPTNYVALIFGEPDKDWKWVDKSKILTERINTGIDCAFCMAGAKLSWNPRGTTDTWQRAHWWGFQDVMVNKPNRYPPDWYIPYNLKGTAVEASAVDAYTLIEEAKANIILGKRPLDDWDGVVAQFRKMYGDAFQQLATQQYNAFVKK
jgi:putative aldouronate transport system substrate-binding protein